MDANEARVELIKILDLDDMAGGEEATWDDIVYYTAKAKSTTRMANAAVERRTAAVYEAAGLWEARSSWQDVLRAIRETREREEMR